MSVEKSCTLIRVQIILYLLNKPIKSITMKTVKLLIAMVIIASLSACTGKDGAPGATGPAGVANITSNIYSITPGSWSNPSAGEYVVNISDADITSSNTDGVEVFLGTGNGIWLGLPASSTLSNGDNLEFDYQDGQIGLIYLFSSTPVVTIDIKVVVIPPAAMNIHPNTNWHDYAQVNAIIEAQKAFKN